MPLFRTLISIKTRTNYIPLVLLANYKNVYFNALSIIVIWQRGLSKYHMLCIYDPCYTWEMIFYVQFKRKKYFYLYSNAKKKTNDQLIGGILQELKMQSSNKDLTFLTCENLLIHIN